MTHYMELLADNQPWNLILFMAIPVILAETVAITELFILYSRQYHGSVRNINRIASIIGGIYFTGLFILSDGQRSDTTYRQSWLARCRRRDCHSQLSGRNRATAGHGAAGYGINWKKTGCGRQIEASCDFRRPLPGGSAHRHDSKV